jgi:hypothetical protein
MCGHKFNELTDAEGNGRGFFKETADNFSESRPTHTQTTQSVSPAPAEIRSGQFKVRN